MHVCRRMYTYRHACLCLAVVLKRKEIVDAGERKAEVEKERKAAFASGLKVPSTERKSRGKKTTDELESDGEEGGERQRRPVCERCRVMCIYTPSGGSLSLRVSCL